MKRIHRRFQAVKGQRVMFSTSNAPNIARQAKIIDISMGGLSIGYISMTRSTEELVELTILGNDVTLACRSVYDCDLPWKGFDSFTRRCGVEFVNLSKENIRQVRNIIQFRTIDGPNERNQIQMN